MSEEKIELLIEIIDEKFELVEKAFDDIDRALRYLLRRIENVEKSLNQNQNESEDDALDTK